MCQVGELDRRRREARLLRTGNRSTIWNCGQQWTYLALGIAISCDQSGLRVLDIGDKFECRSIVSFYIGAIVGDTSTLGVYGSVLKERIHVNTNPNLRLRMGFEDKFSHDPLQ